MLLRRDRGRALDDDASVASVGVKVHANSRLYKFYKNNLILLNLLVTNPAAMQRRTAFRKPPAEVRGALWLQRGCMLTHCLATILVIYCNIIYIYVVIYMYTQER